MKYMLQFGDPGWLWRAVSGNPHIEKKIWKVGAEINCDLYNLVLYSTPNGLNVKCRNVICPVYDVSYREEPWHRPYSKKSYRTVLSIDLILDPFDTLRRVIEDRSLWKGQYVAFFGVILCIDEIDSIHGVKATMRFNKTSHIRLQGTWDLPIGHPEEFDLMKPLNFGKEWLTVSGMRSVL